MRDLGLRILAAATALNICMPATAGAARLLLPAGTEIPLVTAQPLSSKTNVKGDMVALTVNEDIMAEGLILIPKGTAAMGQITDARAKGALGMSGQIALRPLYAKLGDTYVRLGGTSSEKASVTAGAVIGMILLTPGFTGRSAQIPQGTAFKGFVEHGVELEIANPPPR